MHSHRDELIEPLETFPGYRIGISDATHLVIINERPLLWSANQYRVLVLLLRSPDRVVSFARLVGEGYQPDDWLVRQNLRRVISRVRARLWPFSLDIRCLLGHGYLLFVLPDDAP
jgi:DNA-binding response OmpR family regulator